MIKRFLLSTLCIVFIGFADNDYVWTETTQEDFADGTYERNIYASHRDEGTVEFAPRFDLNNDGYIDLSTTDSYGPYARTYWGSATGYSPGNVTLFSTTGASDCDFADLNNDGYPEFLVAHRMTPKISIYWGTPTGPDPNNHLDFPSLAQLREAVFIADFNKDGYLDIATSQEFISGHGAIFWGSASGYSISNRTDLPVQFGVYNIEVADFNQDNWLDILFTQYFYASPGESRIYWGSNAGFSTSNFTALPGPHGNHGSTVADLNQDSFLDLILTGWYGPQSYIYWGSTSGYSQSNMQILNPSYSRGGSSVAYMNDDNYLDIVYFHGGYFTTQQRIYWGSASGYSDGNVSYFGIPLELTGGFVADLNYDGDMDVFCHAIVPGSYSYIFWGPSLTNYTALPVNSDHAAMFREIGNVYNREYYDDYISSAFDAAGITDWGTIEWDASLLRGSSILFWVRSGDSPTPDTSWSDWYSVYNGDSIPDNLNARYLQYKARLGFTNPCYLPSLEEIRVTYASSGIIPAHVRILPRVINLNCHGRFLACIKLPAGYNPHEIDVETVECEGAMALWGFALWHRFIAIFAVQDLVGVSPGPAVEFMVTGQLFDGTTFCGYDTVRVIGHDVTAVELMCTPNPFRNRTAITFSTGQSAKSIALKIYDITGRLIRSFPINQLTSSPVNQIIWDRKDNIGRKVPSGVYLLKVQGDGTSVTKKVVVLD